MVSMRATILSNRPLLQPIDGWVTCSSISATAATASRALIALRIPVVVVQPVPRTLAPCTISSQEELRTSRMTLFTFTGAGFFKATS